MRHTREPSAATNGNHRHHRRDAGYAGATQERRWGGAGAALGRRWGRAGAGFGQGLGGAPCKHPRMQEFRARFSVRAGKWLACREDPDMTTATVADLDDTAPQSTAEPTCGRPLQMPCGSAAPATANQGNLPADPQICRACHRMPQGLSPSGPRHRDRSPTFLPARRWGRTARLAPHSSPLPGRQAGTRRCPFCSFCLFCSFCFVLRLQTVVGPRRGAGKGHRGRGEAHRLRKQRGRAVMAPNAPGRCVQRRVGEKWPGVGVGRQCATCAVCTGWRGSMVRDGAD